MEGSHLAEIDSDPGVGLKSYFNNEMGFTEEMCFTRIGQILHNTPRFSYKNSFCISEPADTGHKLNIYKTFRRLSGHQAVVYGGICSQFLKNENVLRVLFRLTKHKIGVVKKVIKNDSNFYQRKA